MYCVHIFPLEQLEILVLLAITLDPLALLAPLAPLALLAPLAPLDIEHQVCSIITLSPMYMGHELLYAKIIRF